MNEHRSDLHAILCKPAPRGARLPAIDAADKHLPTVTSAALGALHAANRVDPTYFLHGTPVLLDRDQFGRPIIVPLTRDRMRHALARAAYWYTGEEEARPAYPPLEVVRDVLATPADEMPLPVLVRLVEVPIVGSDGIRTTPGYDPATKTYYAPDAALVVRPVPEDPSTGDVEEAHHLIVTELLGDFPFVSDADRAHAIALFLLPFLLELIDGPTPLHLIEKPAPGVAATEMVKALGSIVSTKPIPIITECASEEEWRKKITGKLRQAPALIVLDNLRRRLDSAALSAAITAGVFEDRLLGRSETVQLPVECAWVGTGNNPLLSNEIARRTVRIRLDAATEKPFIGRKFRHPDLQGWIRENRGRLVWSFLVFAQRWVAAGRPLGSERLGSFDAWSQIMGGILDVAGIPGFLGNLESFHEASDVESAALRGFIAAWWEKHRTAEVGTKDLYGIAGDLDLGGGGRQGQKTRLGYVLRSLRDRHFGRIRVEAASSRQHA